MLVDNEKLKINEIFYSIQGESTYAGLPCVFVRLAHCNLRCTYCDTTYAFFEGQHMTIAEIMQKVQSYNCSLVEITGGEPLLQQNVRHLFNLLCDRGYEVLLETGGHVDIQTVDKRVKIIMDLKCPSSAQSEKVLWSNLHYLKPVDEIKFVIGNRADFDWAVHTVLKHDLNGKYTLLFSPVFGQLDLSQLAAWIMDTKLSLRLQVQLHKFIWGVDKRGV